MGAGGCGRMHSTVVAPCVARVRSGIVGGGAARGRGHAQRGQALGTCGLLCKRGARLPCLSPCLCLCLGCLGCQGQYTAPKCSIYTRWSLCVLSYHAVALGSINLPAMQPLIMQPCLQSPFPNPCIYTSIQVQRAAGVSPNRTTAPLDLSPRQLFASEPLLGQASHPGLGPMVVLQLQVG